MEALEAQERDLESKLQQVRIEKEKLASFDRTSSTKSFLEMGFTILEPGTSDYLIITTGSLSHDVLAAAKEFQAIFGWIPRILDFMTTSQKKNVKSSVHI